MVWGEKGISFSVHLNARCRSVGLHHTTTTTWLSCPSFLPQLLLLAYWFLTSDVRVYYCGSGLILESQRNPVFNHLIILIGKPIMDLDTNRTVKNLCLYTRNFKSPMQQTHSHENIYFLHYRHTLLFHTLLFSYLLPCQLTMRNHCHVYYRFWRGGPFHVYCG